MLRTVCDQHSIGTCDENNDDAQQICQFVVACRCSRTDSSLTMFSSIMRPAILLIVLTIAAQISGQDQHVPMNIVPPTCPQGYVLQSGLCYEENHLPNAICQQGYYYSAADNLCYPYYNAVQPNRPTAPSAPTASSVVTPDKLCPPGYYLSSDSLCWLQNPACCGETTLTQTTTTTTTTTPPIIDALTRCPPDTVFMEEMCRKLICTKGEYYEGRCVQAACPTGSVWFGKRCQSPGYMTTILEIENNIHNTKLFEISTDNINNVEYNTQAPFNETIDEGQIEIGQRPTVPSITTTTTELPPANITDVCCKVITARLCKIYGRKWVCFNKRRNMCDARVCLKPIVYLKPPEVVYEPPLLVMPPNPPLTACKTSTECSDGDAIDCSGCAHNDRSHCSLYCYQYRCPNDGCHFMELQDYCEMYPGELGCTNNEGCIWDWCGEKC